MMGAWVEKARLRVNQDGGLNSMLHLRLFSRPLLLQSASRITVHGSHANNTASCVAVRTFSFLQVQGKPYKCVARAEIARRSSSFRGRFNFSVHS